jgi:hypothetical protein
MKREMPIPPLPPLRSLLTVRQLHARYPCWSEAALRDLILNSRDRLTSRGQTIPGNGLGRAIVRFGRKVLIDERLFIEFISEQSKREGYVKRRCR